MQDLFHVHIGDPGIKRLLHDSRALRDVNSKADAVTSYHSSGSVAVYAPDMTGAVASAGTCGQT